jgi:hypothetical protein
MHFAPGPDDSFWHLNLSAFVLPGTRIADLLMCVLAMMPWLSPFRVGPPSMKLHVLVFVLDGGAVEISHHQTRAQAERVAAERIMRTMPTETTVDLSGVATAMDEAFTSGDDAAVIRFFERIKRRKPVHIQECRVPWIQAILRMVGYIASRLARTLRTGLRRRQTDLATSANNAASRSRGPAQGRQPVRGLASRRPERHATSARRAVPGLG